MRVNPSFLQETLSIIDDQFQECPDLVKRKFSLNKGHEAFFIFFDGMVNFSIVQRDMIGPILGMDEKELGKEESLLNLPPAKLRVCRDGETVITALLSGEAVFIYEGIECGIAADLHYTECNDIPPLKGEHSKFGPSKSFQEGLSANLAILRNSMRSSRLKFRILESETDIRKKIAVAYLKGIAEPELLLEATRRVRAIINEESNDGQFERTLNDFRFSPFPEFQITQRPDLTVAALQEGRVAVFREGSPIVILAPANFFNFFHAPDDCHTHWILSSGMRLARIVSTLAVIVLPALYIAFSSYHYQFLNWDTLITLAQSRAKVPVLPFIEVVFMEIFLAIVYELGFRLPNHSGILIGIVGGLTVGGILLATGLISSALLIISALSLMATLMIPIYHIETIRMLRWLFILFSGILGMLGVAISASLTFAHLLILTSMGQPYLQPFIPFQFRKAMSTLLNVPRQYLYKNSNKGKILKEPRGK